MFESIKLKVIKGRQLNPFATAKVLQDHEDRLNALEGEGSSEEDPEIPKRNISITVNEGGSILVRGASVVIGEVTKTTGSAGGCTFQNVPDGEHTVIVMKNNTVVGTESINVSESNTSFVISISPTPIPES